MSELSKWAALEGEARGIDALLEWLNSNNFEVMQTKGGAGLLPLSMSRDQIAYAVLGIDGARLEQERAALLTTAQEAAEADTLPPPPANEDQVDLQGARRNYTGYIVRVRYPQIVVESRLAEHLTTADVCQALDHEFGDEGYMGSEYAAGGGSRPFWHTSINGHKVVISFAAGLANHVFCALDDR